MILNPRAFAEKNVTGYNPDDLSPNGLDVRVSEIYMLEDTTTGRLNGTTRSFPKRTKLVPVDGEYILFPNKHYEVITPLQVKMPEDAAGWLIHRSSLLRMGVIASSGVYDSGFQGGVNLFLRTGPCLVALGQTEKVAQFIVLDAHSCKSYNGYFQGTSSTIEAAKKNS